MKRTMIAIALLFALPLTMRAQDRVQRLLEMLTNAPGPSGYEEPVAKIMIEQYKPLADKILYDGMARSSRCKVLAGPASCWMLIWTNWAD